MGEDFKYLKMLSFKNSKSIPIYAILLQSSISLFFILTSTFEVVITYIGFTLNLFTFMTVLGLFIHRYKFKDADRPYKTWGYPITPIVFLLIIGYISYRIIILTPVDSFSGFLKNPATAGFLTIILGFVFYYLNNHFKKSNPKN